MTGPGLAAGDDAVLWMGQVAIPVTVEAVRRGYGFRHPVCVRFRTGRIRWCAAGQVERATPERTTTGYDEGR